MANATELIAKAKRQSRLYTDLKRALQAAPMEGWEKIVFMYRLKGATDRTVEQVVGKK